MAAPAFILLVLAVGLGHLASQRSLRLGRKGLGPPGPLKGEAAAQLASRGGAALSEFSLLPSSPPPCAPTLLQLPASLPEQSTLLCPAVPSRASQGVARPADQSLCNWSRSCTASPQKALPPPTPQVTAFLEPGCSPRGVVIMSGIRSAPVVQCAWEPGSPLGSTAPKRPSRPRPPPWSLFCQNGAPGVSELCACMTLRGRSFPVGP